MRYPDVPPNPPLDPRVEQQRVYESAFSFFASLAQRFPLLLVIEDVHWADGGTLALVRALARRFQQAHTPAMIVLTYRDAELTDQKGITDLLSTWNRERMATSLKLHRLDRQGTGVMLEALFAESVAVDFVDTIYHETEGNPFFIEELCKALIEGGQIYRENGSWKRRSTQSIELPRSIRMAIEARFNSLPAASVEVLYLASILGRRFEFDVLQAAAPGEEEDTLITALEDAEGAQLLHEIGHGRGGVFEFAHAMIPTTLVEGLSGMRRRRLHRRVITALEKLHPEDYKTLAHHCLQASEDGRALEYLIQAARSARAAFAHTEAVANYQQAAGVLNDLLHEKAPADSLRTIAVQLYEDLGNGLQLIAGQHEEAWKNYQNALSLTAPDDPFRFSRLYRRMGKTRETLLLYKEAEEAYGKAEIALGTEPAGAAPDLLAQWRQEWLTIQLDRFYLCYWQGNIQEMERLAVSIRPMIEQYGTSLQYAKFNYSLAMMLLRKHHYIVVPELFGYLDLAIVAVQKSGDLGEWAYTRFTLGFCFLWNWELEKAEKELLEALQLIDQSGDIVTKSRCLTYLTITYRKLGDVNHVQKYAALSMETATIAQMIEYISMAQANLAWAALRQGNFQQALEFVETAWEVMQKTPQSRMFNWIAVWPLLNLSLVQNQLAGAVDFARKLLDPVTQPQPEALAALLQSAIQAWEQDQPENAAAFLQQTLAPARALGYI